MTIRRRRAVVARAALLAATLAFAAPLGAQPPVNRQDATRAARPDVGVVRGTVVYGSKSRPDSDSEVWVVIGTIALPTDCTVFSSERELTIGECSSRNVSIPFAKHATADAGGRFEIGGLPTGDYTFVIRSAHAIGTDKRDAGRKIQVTWFSIKGGDTKEINAKF